MTEYKTPEQIAEETLRHEYGLTVEDYPTAEDAMQKVLDVADDQTAADLLDTIAKAIEADRKQRTWQVSPSDDDREALEDVAWAALEPHVEDVIDLDLNVPADNAVMRILVGQVADAFHRAGFRRQGPITDAVVRAAALRMAQLDLPDSHTLDDRINAPWYRYMWQAGEVLEAAERARSDVPSTTEQEKP